MSFKKISMLLMMMVVALFTVHNTASANTAFEDVPKSNNAYEEINFLVNKNVISGYTEKGKQYFKPSKEVTRGQAAKMVVLATGNTGLTVKESSFDDIKVDTELSFYTERALSKGWFQYTSGKNFSPSMVVSRMEMAKIISNAYGLDVSKYAQLELPFKDVNKSDMYYKYIAAVYYSGIAKGKTTTTFDPKSGVTRAQFASFVARATSDKYRLSLPIQGVAVPDNAKALGEVEITTTSLNVRASADFSANNVVGTVSTGTVLKYYEVGASYYKVAYKGEYAYISKTYAKVVEKDAVNPAPTPVTPAPTPSEATPIPDDAKALGEIEITTNGLNVRSTANFASTADNVIGQVSKGDVLKYYEAGSSYYKVAYKGEFAYISKTYAKIYGESTEQPSTGSGSTVETPPVKTTMTGIVTSATLAVRAQASSSSTLVATLKRGAQLSVQSVTGNWVKVTYQGKTAYVHKTYVRLKNNSGSPIAGRIIILDPGHGGSDPGAVSKVTGSREKDIVLKVGLKVKALLEARGAIVYMTRSTDKYLTLDERPQYALNKNGEMFVSIHANSAAASANGTETFVSVSNAENTVEDQALAKLVNNEIVKNASMRDRGVKKADYLVIRKLAMPSILIELGFISNDSDEAKLVSDKYQNIYAQSIYNGIVKYYER